MSRPTPPWFTLAERANPEVMRRIAGAATATKLSPQINGAATLAHWFLLDSLLLANQPNREGMHANALALTRQCIEAIGVIELGICGHAESEAMLLKWDADQLTPGKLRAWLEAHVWPAYGCGPLGGNMGRLHAAVFSGDTALRPLWPLTRSVADAPTFYQGRAGGRGASDC